MKKKVTSVNLRLDIISALNDRAREEDRSFSSMVNILLAKDLLGPKRSSPPSGVAAIGNHPASDHLFEMFWAAGMAKKNKAKAKTMFNRIIKAQGDPESFTDKLIFDVGRRIKSGQLGFAEMHPTTYLNNNRWEDEVTTNAGSQQTTGRRESQLERFHRECRERDIREAGIKPSVGNNDFDIRQQVDVSSGGATNLGGCLEGDFTRDGQEGVE